MSSTGGRCGLRIKDEKDLAQISDLVIAFAVMQDLNIDMSGVSDMTEALERIKQNFRSSSAEQIYNQQVITVFFLQSFLFIRESVWSMCVVGTKG